MKDFLNTEVGPIKLESILYINREKKILYENRAVRLEITDTLEDGSNIIDNEEILKKLFPQDKWFWTGRFIINIAEVTFCCEMKGGGEVMFAHCTPVRQLFLDRKSCGDSFKELRKKIIWEQTTQSSKDVDEMYLKRYPYKKGDYIDPTRPRI